MRKTCDKLAALLTAVCLLFSLAQPAAAAGTGEITITTVADLLELTRNCSLDTWSQGKTVRLAADLDLTGAAFTPIPTFGGTFDGQGHTISGLSLTANGSKQGLFRTIQPGGVVENLNVSGTVAPGGSQTNVGGIAGVNGGHHPELYLQRSRLRKGGGGRHRRTQPGNRPDRGLRSLRCDPGGERHRRHRGTESGRAAHVQQQRQRQYQ